MMKKILPAQVREEIYCLFEYRERFSAEVWFGLMAYQPLCVI